MSKLSKEQITAWLSSPIGIEAMRQAIREANADIEELQEARIIDPARLRQPMTNFAKVMERIDIPKAKRCHKCNSPRWGDACRKCGGPLEDVCEGWDDPRLPPIDKIRQLADEKGYCIAVHGTLERDLDLVAVPWKPNASTWQDMVLHLLTGLDARIIAGEIKPHGRYALNIQLNGWYKIIDLSIVPLLKDEDDPDQNRQGLPSR